MSATNQPQGSPAFMEFSVLLHVLCLFLATRYFYGLTMKKLRLEFPGKSHPSGKQRLPPGPSILLTLVLLPFHSLRHPADLRNLVRWLRAAYGPIVSLRTDLSSSPTIIVTDRRLIREALVERGAVFAARPQRSIEPGPVPIIGGTSTVTFGQHLRLLRQTLASGIFNPCYLRSLAGQRRWAFGILKKEVQSQAETSDGVVEIRDALECTVLSLIGFMCYGEKLEESLVHGIKEIHTQLMSIYNELSFDFLPKAADFFFHSRSNDLLSIRRKFEEVFFPIIKARRALKQQRQGRENHSQYCYVDSLLEVRLPEESSRGLDDGEILTMCSELHGAACEQVSTTVEWIIANLVRGPHMQQRLLEEIQQAMKEDSPLGDDLKEESLEGMEYLNAVILEGLRRHPPSHLLLPHAVTEETTLGGYMIPKKARILFPVEEMALDESIWKEPLEFRPERFLAGGEGYGVRLKGDIQDLKMMPFGLGRRACPASNVLSVFLLKYLVANMVKDFKWERAEGEADIKEKGKIGLAVAMAAPLRVKISLRNVPT